MKNEKYNNYNIIVIGSGLAGSESGIISAKIGLKTLVINISMDNPSVLKFSSKTGGVLKDTLLNENNYLGGFINNAIYKNQIAQKKERKKDFSSEIKIVDKRKFTLFYKFYLENINNLDTRQGLVTEIENCSKNKNKKYVVKLSDGSIFFSQAVIIATGTFLNAKILWGENEIDAGRQGEINSIKFYESLKKFGYSFKKERAYVGPRIDKRSIRLKKIGKIKSEEKVSNKELEEIECAKYYNKNIIWQKYFLFKSKINKNEISKYIDEVTKNYKNDKFEKLINTEWFKSKIINFKKEDFEIQIFPEGDKTIELYLDKFYFAFSDKEQNDLLNKFSGLENARIIKPGYCIEYAALKKGQIKQNLESKIHENIFFAGEVNGSASYESAALQGLVAGICAALGLIENGKLLSNKKLIKIFKFIDAILGSRQNQVICKKDIKIIIFEKIKSLGNLVCN